MRIVSLSGCLLCQELGSFMYALASALYIMLLKVIMCMQRHKSRRQIKRKQEGMSTREERSLRQTEGTIQPCLRWKGKGFHRSFFFFRYAWRTENFLLITHWNRPKECRFGKKFLKRQIFTKFHSAAKARTEFIVFNDVTIYGGAVHRTI